MYNDLLNSKWSRFYRNRISHEYYSYFVNKYRVFLNEIQESIRLNDNVIELGCGISNTTSYLIESLTPSFFKATIVDNDKGMLILSAMNLDFRLSTEISKSVDMIEGSILNGSPKGQIGHSHGVLEHFTDEEIQKIIRLQKRTFRKLIHYVPSYKYRRPSFGDERLMTKEEWNNICQPDKIVEFNNGYDYMLIWRGRND